MTGPWRLSTTSWNWNFFARVPGTPGGAIYEKRFLFEIAERMEMGWINKDMSFFIKIPRSSNSYFHFEAWLTPLSEFCIGTFLSFYCSKGTTKRLNKELSSDDIISCLICILKRVHNKNSVLRPLPPQKRKKKKVGKREEKKTSRPKASRGQRYPCPA